MRVAVEGLAKPRVMASATLVLVGLVEAVMAASRLLVLAPSQVGNPAWQILVAVRAEGVIVM
jgi:hypothetical protein